MKFAAAVVVLAMAVSAANCSVVSWPWHSEVAGHGLSYTAVSGPAPAAWAAPWAPAAAWAPAASAWWPAAHAPASVVVAAAPHAPAVWAVAPAEGSYVAKTRGAVHTAPLSGHVQSVANVNVAPAPGTV